MSRHWSSVAAITGELALWCQSLLYCKTLSPLFWLEMRYLSEKAMNTLLLSLSFLWAVVFLLYACFLINKQRNLFSEKMGFFDLWLAVGSRPIKRKKGIGASDEERLRELEFRLRRAVYILVLLMVVTFMAFAR